MQPITDTAFAVHTLGLAADVAAHDTRQLGKTMLTLEEKLTGCEAQIIGALVRLLVAVTKEPRNGVEYREGMLEDAIQEANMTLGAPEAHIC